MTSSSTTAAQTRADAAVAPRAETFDPTPELSVRSVVTGMLVGAILAACNIYSGLKIGWSNNMSVPGALLSYATWRLPGMGTRKTLSILETNLAQTAASSAAAVSSAGLVAGIPALALLTGLVLPWPKLALWVLSVCLVGNVIGVPLRRAMIVRDPLPFPFGIATAETLKQMYAEGAEAMKRVRVLLAAALVAGAFKPLEAFKVVKSVGLPGTIGGYGLKNLTWALDPSPLLVAVGGLMGLRSCVSVMAGATIAYAVGAPAILARGLVSPGAVDKSWFQQLATWLLWPGVTLMVVSSLTSFALSWRSIARAFEGLSGNKEGNVADTRDVPTRWFLRALVAVFLLSIALQISFFGIPWWAATVAVLLSFALGVVGARVNGETGVTPVGAMGKVTQLVMGAAVPGDSAVNLMAANVTGGSASQCADLLNDLKTGHLLGASPRSQWIAQLSGSLAGALAGSAIYLVLIHDPKAQLITQEWAAPAVMTWKAVAEVFKTGLTALPPGTRTAIALAAIVGLALAILETKLPKERKRWFPSPAALGLGFVVPANQSLSMFAGGLLAVAVSRWRKEWYDRFWIVVCAGVIAGESLVGVAISVWQMTGR